MSAATWPGANLTHDEFLGNEDRSRLQSGGYDLVEVVRDEPLKVIEIVRARLADDYFRLDLRLRPDGGTVDKLTLTPIDRPNSVVPPSRVTTDELGRQIDQRIAAMGDFSGAVLVAVAGRPIYQRASGEADKEAHAPNTLETPFRMASMGKMFTAVAVMQLVEAGKLDLDAPIGRYLPDYPNAAFAQTVTTRQLLIHTGGAGDFMSQRWADNIDRLRTPADYVAMFGTRPPDFPPGSRFDYSNFGFVILGRLVEVASGRNYGDYLRERIFAPAHMTHAGLDPQTATRPVAKTYVTASGHFQRPPTAPFSRPATPAGGAYASVGDLLNFAQALTAHRLINEQKASSQAWIKQAAGEVADYGFGFQLRDDRGVTEIGHTGGGPGENGALWILDDGKAVVVVLSNVAPIWRGDKLASFITSRVPLR